MHRSELPTDFPVFEKILISSWAILQLTTGILGLIVLTEAAPSPHSADRPTQHQVKHSSQDSSAIPLMSEADSIDRWQRLPYRFYAQSQ